MITANDVFTVLCSNYDSEEYSDEELLSCCNLGLGFVKELLRPGVSDDNPLIAETAAAVARYHFFVRTLSRGEKYDSYRVGDISISNDFSKALEREILIRNEALARAHSILKDGGFVCHAG